MGEAAGAEVFQDDVDAVGGEQGHGGFAEAVVDGEGGDGADFVGRLPVRRFFGIGPRGAEKMAALGIETGADLRAKDIHFLRQHFGSQADYLYRAARGIDLRRVKADRARKSLGAERTLDKDLASGAALRDIVSNVEATADQVSAIAAASEEQSAASEEINHSIVQVNAMSGQTAQAMGEASKAVADLAQQARRLSELIDEMKQG